MSYSIEQVAKDLVLAEGPHWDPDKQVLYFVDVFSDTVHSFNPSTNVHKKASVEGSPTFVIPIEGTNDKFVMALFRHLAIVTWDGISDVVSKTEKIVEVDVIEDVRGNRLNDGKVDFTGKLWTGTSINIATLHEDFPGVGKIYSLDSDLQLKSHEDGISLSNGLAWNEDLKKFYYIDSAKRAIFQFDYNVEEHVISNRMAIFSLEKHNLDGLPDGQTIDADGNLWVALINGAKIIQIDPRVPETLLRTIEMPAKQVTSVAFGGENLDELYVTTARGVLGIETPLTPADGALFRITGLGVRGLNARPFRLNLPIS